MNSKEQTMREALGMIGVDTTSDKMPPPMSNLKMVPLAPPKCLREVSENLAKSPVPFVGLQVPSSNNLLWFFTYSLLSYLKC